MTHRDARMTSALLLMLSGIGIVYAVGGVRSQQPMPGEPTKVFVRPSMLALPGEKGTRFLMGDDPQHPVRLASRFALSETEVTRGQYKAVMGDNPRAWADCKRPDDPTGDDSHYPVVCVTFIEAAQYCNKLTLLEYPEGKDEKGLEVKPCYEFSGDEVIWPTRFACRGYRVPTAAEWEYAARGRDKWKIYAGTDEDAEVCKYGNVADQGAKDKHPEWNTFECRDGSVGPAKVGGKLHNGWYLHDMTGNVEELVWDGDSDLRTGEIVDAGGVPSEVFRMVRGGSWSNDAQNARVSYIGWGVLSGRSGNLGFRLSRSLP